VAYHLLLELLASSGFTVIATPYLLTFKHLDCARAVASDFATALAELREGGRAYLAPAGAPVVGVGHSNGALLHLLVGAVAPGHADANAVVSFNNK
jgi:alpha-beta hydrolase superfamily lysophospholipase